MVSAEESLLAQAAFDEYGSEDHDAAGGAAVAEHSTEAYVVPLARTTRVEFDGLSGDLVADLDALASGRVPVLVLTKIEPEKAPRSRRSPGQKAPKPRRPRRRPKPEKAERGRAEGDAPDRGAEAEQAPRRRPPRPRSRSCRRTAA